MPREILITIPDDFDFATLQLRRDIVSGVIEFEWKPLEQILRLSGHDPAIVWKNDGAMANLVLKLYQAHREGGGRPDWVQESILAEAAAEREHGARVQRAPASLQ